MTAAVTAASGLLLLSACGGSDGGSEKSDDIQGAKKAGRSGSPSAGAEASPGATKDPDAPDFDFPKGTRAVIADEATGDEKKDEVLRDHGYSLKAGILAAAEGDPDHALAYTYVQDSAGEMLRANLRQTKKKGQVSTGTYAYYDRKVELKGSQGAVIRFCESQRKAFGKVIKTGKVLRTKPSMRDFTSVRDILQKRGDGWRVVSTAVKGSDPKCAR
ncbi:hypothetical protein [Streptomyces sp. NPDC048172]|uniref:hypothetical protein n=1 Tax=Streptomyces sp. NPDC048172 TaxID=3365505 RepID=UPI003721085D